MANQSQNLDDPSLCVNNCGFFGNPSTNNLCSKCYKEYIMKHSHEEIKENNIESVVSDETHVDVGGSHTTSTSNVENRAANRCNLCKKKVGLTGFKCRCGHTFCSSHRYSDKHGCIFDYKGAGQDAIARANPVVKADKIEKI